MITLMIKLTASHGSFLFALIKLILIPIFSHFFERLFSITSSYLLLCLISIPDNHEDSPPHDHDDHDQINLQFSASLAPISAHFFAESVKKQLPVMPYKNLLEKNRPGEVHDHDGDQDEDDHKGSVCIVCLNLMEESHEVRVPLHCCHVFHRECLDVWIDQGQGTCPLCRSNLLPTRNHHHDNEHDHQADQWRREISMIYAFGEDFVFGDD